MSLKLAQIFVLLALVTACNNEVENKPSSNKELIDTQNTSMSDTIRPGNISDSSSSSVDEDVIKTNFKRINSISKWSSVVETGLEESSEGGEAKFFYLNRQLEKVIAKHYGEIGQVLIEYYLLNGKLSFALERSYRYNRPIYYDSAAAKESNDTEVFDFKKSEISEIRNYLKDTHLIDQITSPNQVKLSRNHLKEEEVRILNDFELVLASLKRK